MAEPSIVVRLVCRSLPGLRFDDAACGLARHPVYLGIQRGREVVDTVPADRRQVTFKAPLRVRRRPGGAPNFLGPYAHGPPTQRFLYLSWGVREQTGAFTMFRRAKIHLSHLTWRDVKLALDAGADLVAELRLTDAKGGPLCASVREPNIRWVL